MKQYQADSSLNRKQRDLLFYVICVRKKVLTSHSNQISATKGWGRELLEDAGFSKVN